MQEIDVGLDDRFRYAEVPALHLVSRKGGMTRGVLLLLFAYCHRTRVLHAVGISTLPILLRHRPLPVELKTEGGRVHRQPFFVFVFG